jgi:tetratricopeptide (TPR) repeat protein
MAKQVWRLVVAVFVVAVFIVQSVSPADGQSPNSFLSRHSVRSVPATDIPKVVARPFPERADGDHEDALPRLKVRAANAESTARARQFIEYGDVRFGRQQFSEAYQRYRKAAEAAPDLADAYFRQALAQSALDRYLPAVKTIRRGLAIKPDWAKTDFKLDQLYNHNRAAKETHFERLATAANDKPDNAELLYLLGVELFFDGQPARAHAFLKRASDLGLAQNLARPFLDSAAHQTNRRPRGEDL